MKLFDHIKLKYELPELSEKNIHKGCTGEIIEIIDRKYKIIFYAPRIYGDFAVAIVDKDFVEYDFSIDDELIESSKKFITTLDESKHTCLLDDDVHKYDEIEMTAEKEKYAKYGVHKGMRGTVMLDLASDNKWYVVFTKTDGSGEDFADLEVYRDDFKIVYKSPAHRI